MSWPAFVGNVLVAIGFCYHFHELQFVVSPSPPSLAASAKKFLSQKYAKSNEECFRRL
jgi:hypothetical protein